jgi:hypothetical protein
MWIELRHSDTEGQPITHAGRVGLFENVLHAGMTLPLTLGLQSQAHGASLVCPPSPNYQVNAVFPPKGYSYPTFFRVRSTAIAGYGIALHFLRPLPDARGSCRTIRFQARRRTFAGPRPRIPSFAIQVDRECTVIWGQRGITGPKEGPGVFSDQLVRY